MERNLFGPRQLSCGTELFLERHHIDQFAQIMQQPRQIGTLRFREACFARAETAYQPTTEGMLPKAEWINNPVVLGQEIEQAARKKNLAHLPHAQHDDGAMHRSHPAGPKVKSRIRRPQTLS